ncbi:MAG: hypothetical protein QOK21_3681 [Solirubrobacteraceae bacterium]|nr:hypothetical protein [Solirubrobacteraceae bacterium]
MVEIAASAERAPNDVGRLTLVRTFLRRRGSRTSWPPHGRLVGVEWDDPVFDERHADVPPPLAERLAHLAEATLGGRLGRLPMRSADTERLSP